MKDYFNQIINGFRFLVMLLFDFIMLKIRPKTEKEQENIVIIRLDAIGDFIIWLDSAKAIAQEYGGGKLTLIVNSINLEIAKTLPYWDKIIPVVPIKFRKNFFYRFKIIQLLKKASFETIINTTYSRAFWIDDSIVRFISAKRKIGVLSDSTNEPLWKYKISNKWYSKLLSLEKNIKHEFLRNAEILKIIGIKYTPKVFQFPEETIDKKFIENIPDNYFIIFPGSSTPKKEWETKKFAELIDLLIERYKVPCIISGSQSDQKKANEISKVCDKDIIDYTGKTTLRELISLIKNCKFIVTNDTSAIHIAASTNSPGFCILGGGHYGRFLPYRLDEETDILTNPHIIIEKMDCFNCNWNCIYQKNKDTKTIYPCIDKITVNKVFQNIATSI